MCAERLSRWWNTLPQLSWRQGKWPARSEGSAGDDEGALPLPSPTPAPLDAAGEDDEDPATPPAPDTPSTYWWHCECISRSEVEANSSSHPSNVHVYRCNIMTGAPAADAVVDEEVVKGSASGATTPNDDADTAGAPPEPAAYAPASAAAARGEDAGAAAAPPAPPEVRRLDRDCPWCAVRMCLSRLEV